MFNRHRPLSAGLDILSAIVSTEVHIVSTLSVVLIDWVTKVT